MILDSERRIIEALERETGKKFTEVREQFNPDISECQYTCNGEGFVTGILIEEAKITHVPESLAQLKKLANLFLVSNKHLDNITGIGNLQGITSLDLRYTQVSDLSPLAALTGITSLVLRYTQVSDLSPLAALTGITSLVLFNTNVSDLSPLAALTGITSLNLYNTKVSDLSPLAALTGITSLDLDSTQVSDLSPLAALTGITSLNLYNTKVSDLSPLAALTGITSLDLSGTKVSDLSPLAALTGITSLYLNRTNVSDLSPLAALTGITSLYLSGTNVSDLSPLAALTGITSLYLSGTNVSDLSPLAAFIHLKELILSHLRLTDPQLTPLLQLKKLTRLALDNNLLSQLPRAFLDFNMKITWEGNDGISLKDNPLISPPIEIVKQGDAAVRAYFADLDQNSQTLNEVKVLLVGEGGSGKTSLVKRLTGEPFNASEEQTHGINIRNWRAENGCPVSANFWDFGGQEIMHATHQFFLSKRSLYILVLDGRRDERAEYWLDHIRTFGGDSPALVVINKIDQNPGHELNRAFLQKKYPFIKGFYRLSCASEKGIPAFRQALAHSLGEVPLAHTILPKNWFKVKKHLAGLTEHFINLEQYGKICKRHQVTEKFSQETLLDFLHDLGGVVHFRDFHLKHTHVLAPHWLTSAVYRIINSPLLANHFGVLPLELLETILAQEKKDDFYYPADKHPYIIKIMEKFELCYAINNDNVLVPALLPVEEPACPEPEADAIRFILQYNFLPPSLTPRFIVRMREDISDRRVWRSGVALSGRHYQSVAVIRADIHARRIYIHVNGTQRRDYFAAIFTAFRLLHHSYEKLTVRHLVPLQNTQINQPGRDSDTELTVNYDHLLRLEKENQTWYFPEHSEEQYEVAKLLGALRPAPSETRIIQMLETILAHVEHHESLDSALNGLIKIQPEIFGVGIDLNKAIQLVKDFFSKKAKENKNE